MTQTTRMGHKQAVDLRGSHPDASTADTVPTLSAAWAAAVELGGHGDYARAFTALDDLRRRCAGDTADRNALRSLCRSTEASLLRQAGRHRAAQARDGQALVEVAVHLADPDLAALDRVVPHRAALADGLIGLAADNLGLLRFAASRRLLDRARAVLDPAVASGTTTVADRWSWSSADADWVTAVRCRLRWEWVGAELGLYSGAVDEGVAAARAGELLLDGDVPVRHRLKTLLISAAATAASGDVGGAAAAVRSLVDDAGGHGLVPLEWAALGLLTGIGSATPAEGARHHELGAALVGKGMPLVVPSAR